MSGDMAASRAPDPCLHVASQLPAMVNEIVAGKAKNIEIIPVPAGVPVAMPDAATVLLASPVPDFREAAEPAGWPFNLRWIQLASSGIDPYPDWFLRRSIVTSGRGWAADPIAEFALAAIFAAAKQLPDVWIRSEADWNSARPKLQAVSGSTLGLLGFGAIGRAIAWRAVALGMRVQAVRQSEQPFDLDGVARCPDISQLFATSDHVVIAAPSTPATAGIVGRSVLAHCKPGLHLVNVARGALIDDTALLEALDSGRVARATLDATEPEPLPPSHAFYRHPRIRVSPHISASAPDMFARLGAAIADNLLRYTEGKPLNGVVDVDRGY